MKTQLMYAKELRSNVAKNDSTGALNAIDSYIAHLESFEADCAKNAELISAGGR